MTTTEFYLVLNIKAGKDFQTYGKFFLGSNRQLADNVFKNLKGNKKISNSAVLYLELIETNYELPINIHVISCTLEELSDNCKMITKEIFKQFNLEEI